MPENGSESKNLILLLDGTWNDPDYGAADTNIVRLRELISQVMHKQTSAPASPAAGVQAGDVQGRRNVVFYQRGVGTDALNKIRVGAFGAGLNQNVRNAYRFICANYFLNDNIFIFGFSRGAFTARSLAGYVAAAGILKPERCTPANESRAWYYYRDRPAERMSGIAYQFKDDIYPYTESPITCLGIFDTVGALGAPLRRFSKFNRRLYEFHDVYLSSVSKVNLHAVAIDEHRWPFEATLWRRSKFVPLSNITEQVWFSGCHTDIGGGGVEDSERKHELDDIPLDWMLRRLASLDETKDIFPVKPGELNSIEVVKASQTEARGGVYYAYPFAYRSIGNVKLPRLFRQTTVGYDRHNLPQSECIHRSAIDRIGHRIHLGGETVTYRPDNLMAYLKACRDGKATRMPIIDWSGFPIEDDAALELVKAALSRG